MLMNEPETLPFWSWMPSPPRNGIEPRPPAASACGRVRHRCGDAAEEDAVRGQGRELGQDRGVVGGLRVGALAIDDRAAERRELLGELVGDALAVDRQVIDDRDLLEAEILERELRDGGPWMSSVVATRT